MLTCLSHTVDTAHCCVLAIIRVKGLNMCCKCPKIYTEIKDSLTSGWGCITWRIRLEWHRGVSLAGWACAGERSWLLDLRAQEQGETAGAQRDRSVIYVCVRAPVCAELPFSICTAQFVPERDRGEVAYEMARGLQRFRLTRGHERDGNQGTAGAGESHGQMRKQHAARWHVACWEVCV